ncbi:MAG: SDR family oxidoreductase [Spirochaetota bacterium]
MDDRARVLVTGSSRGIGREIASRFARAGARVVIHGRDETRLRKTASALRSQGFDVAEVVGDAADCRDASRIVEEAAALLGGLDVLVNNAGMIMRGRFADTDSQVWERVVNVNLLGTAIVTRAALSHITASRGSIVFVSSIVGLWGFPLVSAYAASKMALNAMVESMRAELAGSGVHLGVLYVGITQNDPDKRILAADGSPLALSPRPRAMTQAQVAEASYRMVVRRRRSRVLTTGGKAVAVLTRFAPGILRFALRLSARRIDRLAE